MTEGRSFWQILKRDSYEQLRLHILSFVSIECLTLMCLIVKGFRYELTMNRKMFGSFDPVQPLSEAVFAALELLMSDCVLATEPSTNAILVTNNLFSMNCGALARGVVFKDFEIQVISEETAEQIQVNYLFKIFLVFL